MQRENIIGIIGIIICVLLVGSIFFIGKNYEVSDCTKYETYYYYVTGGGVAPGINTNLDFSIHFMPETKIYIKAEDAKNYPNVQIEKKCVEGGKWVKKSK